jgi:hypothetical protein
MCNRDEVYATANKIMLAMLQLGVPRNENTAIALRVLARGAVDDRMFQSEKNLAAEIDFQLAEMERKS